jgi:hypothetical protein
MVVLAAWSKLKNLARGDQGENEVRMVRCWGRQCPRWFFDLLCQASIVPARGLQPKRPRWFGISPSYWFTTLISLRKQPVVRRCWKFIAECASVAVQDVVQQVSPVPVLELRALAGVYLVRDGDRVLMNIEMDVEWSDDKKNEQAALDAMEVDLGLLDPGLLKDSVAVHRPAETCGRNEQQECETGGRGATGDNEKRSGACLPAASGVATGGSEDPSPERDHAKSGATEERRDNPSTTPPPTDKSATQDAEKTCGNRKFTEPSAPNGVSERPVAVTPPTVNSAANHSTRSGRCLKRPPRFEEDEEAVVADAAATKVEQKRPRARSGHCYTEAQVRDRVALQSRTSDFKPPFLTRTLFCSD